MGKRRGRREGVSKARREERVGIKEEREKREIERRKVGVMRKRKGRREGVLTVGMKIRRRRGRRKE